MNTKAFSREVCEKLGHYVYRLIDPRDNKTFYVGKGQNNRVFAHAKNALKNFEGANYLDKNEDEESTKIQQIREIIQDGQEVKMVIHRWGLNESEAFAVEAALIDCYPNLTNIQSGHDSEKGVNDVETIQRTLSLKPFDDSKAAKNEYLIIKINQRSIDVWQGEESEKIYRAVRSRWKIDIKKAKSYKYILACKYGVVVGIYKKAKWKHSIEPGRYEFDAVPLNEKDDAVIINRYFYKLLPERYMVKGASNPVMYQSK